MAAKKAKSHRFKKDVDKFLVDAESSIGCQWSERLSMYETAIHQPQISPPDMPRVSQQIPLKIVPGGAWTSRWRASSRAFLSSKTGSPCCTTSCVKRQDFSVN